MKTKREEFELYTKEELIDKKRPTSRISGPTTATSLVLTVELILMKIFLLSYILSISSS